MLKSKPCSEEGCERPSWAKGLCRTHGNSISSLPKAKPLVRDSRPDFKVKKRLKLQSDRHKEGKEQRILDGLRMMQLFEEHWNSHPNKKCEVCDKQLYGDNNTMYHDHALEKSKWKNLKFEIDNLILVCPDCHSSKWTPKMSEKYKQLIIEIKKHYGIL